MLDLRQKFFLQKTKLFLDKFKRVNFKKKYDSNFYLNSYSEGIGKSLLNGFINKKISYNYKNFLKEILYGVFYSNPKILKHKKIDIRNFEKIIITWAYKNQFSSNGRFKDRYTNEYTDSMQNSLWFTIYMSDELPNKIQKNIILIKPFSKSSLNLFSFLKHLLFSLKNIKYGLNYFFSAASSNAYFAHQVGLIYKKVLHSKLKLVMIFYEGQPFQNYIIRITKKFNNKIKILGYIHSPPLGFPSNFIKKFYSPDKIILNGNDQKKCFNNILGWDEKDITIKPSLRFRNKNQELSSKIYLPLNFKKEKKIIDSIEKIIKKKKIDLSSFKVRIHPGSINNKNHIKLKFKIKNLIQSLKLKYTKKNKNLSIFIGASGALIEALENKVLVYHICEDIIFEKFSSSIWNSIKVKNIFKNVYEYSLIKKNSLLKLGSNKISLEDYLKAR